MSKEEMKLRLFRLRKLIEESYPSIDFTEKYSKNERKVIDKITNKMYKIRVKEQERIILMEKFYQQNEIDLNISKKNRSEIDSAKYSLFGYILGLIDGTIKSGFDNIPNDEELLFRQKTSKYYMQIIDAKNINNITTMDMMIYNYPSSKYFLSNYEQMPKEGLEFVKSYTEGYQISDSVSLKKMFFVFENMICTLIKEEKRNKEYVKTLTGN